MPEPTPTHTEAPYALSGPYPTPASHSEAPCSLNIKLRVAGGDVQITGRGQTPAEAVANVLETKALLTAALTAPTAPTAPTPRPSRTQRLGVLLACGTEKAVAQGDLARLTRLVKAYELVVRGHVVANPDGGGALVQSQAAGATTHYRVVGRRCECADYTRHVEAEQSYLCKHGLAYLLVQRLDAQEAADGS